MQMRSDRDCELTQSALLKWAISLVAKAQNEGLFGSITFMLQNGKITNVKTEKSEKPPQLEKVPD